VSRSLTPQPQTPGEALAGSVLQLSTQFGVPSASPSTSLTPQPQTPGEVLSGSVAQASRQSGVPSASWSWSLTPSQGSGIGARKYTVSDSGENSPVSPLEATAWTRTRIDSPYLAEMPALLFSAEAVTKEGRKPSSLRLNSMR